MPTAVASVPSAGGLNLGQLGMDAIMADDIGPEYKLMPDGMLAQRGMIRLDAIAERADDRGAVKAWPLHPNMLGYYRWHIKYNGQQWLEPIIAKKLNLPNVPFTHYEVYDGKHRCWVCRELGLKTILAWVIL